MAGDTQSVPTEADPLHIVLDGDHFAAWVGGQVAECVSVTGSTGDWRCKSVLPWHYRSSPDMDFRGGPAGAARRSGEPRPYAGRQCRLPDERVDQAAGKINRLTGGSSKGTVRRLSIAWHRMTPGVSVPASQAC
jgi:hypothetical protein